MGFLRQSSKSWGRLFLGFCLVAAFNSNGEDAFAQGKNKSSGRRPATAEKSCPDFGCACEELKSKSKNCRAETQVSESKTSHTVYFDLVTLIQKAQDERKLSEFKPCPYLREAELCRQKLKKISLTQKPRNSPHKVSASLDLGNFGIQLIENISPSPQPNLGTGLNAINSPKKNSGRPSNARNPRSPASSR